MLKHLRIIIPLLAATAVHAGAQNIVGSPDGLSGAPTVFDFNGMGLASGTQVTTQLLASGLRFEGAYYGPVTPLYGPSFPTPALYNYAGQESYTTMSVFFTTAVNAVAFNFATTQGESTFSVFRNGSSVRTFSSTLPNYGVDDITKWWGFEFSDGTTFDRIDIRSTPIASAPNAFGIDNLQVGRTAVVPEPATLGLVAAGLLGIVGYRRRRHG